jgi:hypothetical protein
MAQTDPIHNDPDFVAIDAHIDLKLKPKGYKRLPRKGSTSWEDTRIRPKDSAVCWKLCNFRSGITFGVRKELAVKHNLLAQINCPLPFTVDPSDVGFVGFVVTNDPGSLRRIDDVIDLFP